MQRLISSLLKQPALLGLMVLMLVVLHSFSVEHHNGLEGDVLKYTNELRTANHKPVLLMKEEISKIARKHSENMAAGKVAFGHDGFDKRELEVKKSVNEVSLIAENVAYGATTAKEVVDLWNGSKGHRENMLGDYKYIGIGTATDSKGVIYYTQIFAR